MAHEPDPRPNDDELPDPALFWRWVGKATRPVIGWVLLGVGALIILIGWIGVSGTPVVAKQIPYVVSGGIGGVLLAILGAYFLGTEELRKDSGRLDRGAGRLSCFPGARHRQALSGAAAREAAGWRRDHG